MSHRVILASGSESRRAVLAAAGVDAEAIRPNVDEDAAKATYRAQDMSVRDQAMQLAELKSVKVSLRESGLVVGGDQMLSLEGEAFDKPADLEGAREHLRKLGNNHWSHAIVGHTATTRIIDRASKKASGVSQALLAP